jgi:hypothetical protein
MARTSAMAAAGPGRSAMPCSTTEISRSIAREMRTASRPWPDSATSPAKPSHWDRYAVAADHKSSQVLMIAMSKAQTPRWRSARLHGALRGGAARDQRPRSSYAVSVSALEVVHNRKGLQAVR